MAEEHRTVCGEFVEGGGKYWTGDLVVRRVCHRCHRTRELHALVPDTARWSPAGPFIYPAKESTP